MRPLTPDYPLETLTTLNMQEMLRAFKLESQRGVRWLAQRGLYALVQQLSSVALAYDARVGQEGLSAASAWLMTQVTGGVHALGRENIPAGGPLLVVSNHPGLTDAMAIFATLGRDDLRIVAADRGILRLLPNIERYLIYVPDNTDQHISIMRSAAQHLRAGGALLTFPYGAIERDPALYPDAGETLAAWSRSSEVLARLVPELNVLPVLTSGVLSPAALRNPITRLYRAGKERDWAAASLQFLLRRYQDNLVHVTYGRPICGADHHHEAVLNQMRDMMRQTPRHVEMLALRYPAFPL